MITLIPVSRLIAMKGKQRNQNQHKGKNNNPMKTKILRNIILSLSAIFALAITAHAQNLYVSANAPGSHKIFEFTPGGTQSIYASGLDNPRGLAFDSIGNLFATTAHEADDIEIGKVLKFNLRNHVSTAGSAAKFFFEGLAIDIAGNAYVMANDDTSPTNAGTIF
jgi:secreted PhoX family phosphatase